MVFDIRDILRALSAKRPIFHSEADFQFALAWEIQTRFPEAKIRLEVPIRIQRKEYLDIWVRIGRSTILIELKYKTNEIEMGHNGEHFTLQRHAAHLCNRYDFLKDVSRVERFTEQYSNARGYCIMLSNDPQYWQGGGTETLDREFSLREGNVAQGLLAWQQGTSAGTMKNREHPILLHSCYPLHWETYADTSSFRMLVVDVKKPVTRSISQKTIRA